MSDKTEPFKLANCVLIHPCRDGLKGHIVAVAPC
jgi:hypothetical protein